MSEKQNVEVAQYGAGRLKVHESLKYIREQDRIAPIAKQLGIGLLVVSFILVALKKDPAPPQAAADNTPFPAPSVTGAQSYVESMVYDRGNDARRYESDRRRAPPQSTKLSGPKLIPRSVKLRVPPGTEEKGILMTGASNGLVKVKLKEDVIVAGETFLMAGTVLIGSGSTNDDKLFVHFNKAVSDDATVSAIEAEIADATDKSVGLKGSFWATHGSRIAIGAGLNFLAGASEALQDTQGEQGAVVAKPTARNAVLHGTAKAALDESNDVASKYKNAPPAVEIRAGTEVAIIFTDNGGADGR